MKKARALKIAGFAVLVAIVAHSRPTRGAGEPTPAQDPTLLQPFVELDLGYLSTDPVIPWGTDPFLKDSGYAKGGVAEPTYTLTGIVYSRREPMAIVNGISVTVGDEIDGRVVERIGKNFVTLKKGDSIHEVVLPPAAEELEGESDEGGNP